MSDMADSKSFRPHAGPTQIKLENPVADHFESFIFANAVNWEQLCAAELDRCAPDVWADLRDAAPTTVRVDFQERFRRAIKRYAENKGIVEQGYAKGKHIVICGAGPSLKETATKWCKQGDEVWGCNSAMPWLVEHNRRCTHGITVDQTPHMVEEWFKTPDVDYHLASTVHPNLVELLRKRGLGRRIRYFHNFVGIKGKSPVPVGPCPACAGTGTMGGGGSAEAVVGATGAVVSGTETRAGTICAACSGTATHVMEYEDWLYALLFLPTMRAGSGLNTVTRAVDLALFADADHITVLGADHALRFRKPPPPGVIAGAPEHTAWLKNDVVMHADGGHPLVSGATAMTLEGWVCPDHDDPCKCKRRRLWISKPDMIISAVFLVKMARKLEGRLTIVGDTLPGALMAKSDDFLRKLPTLVDSNGKPIEIW